MLNWKAISFAAAVALALAAVGCGGPTAPSAAPTAFQAGPRQAPAPCAWSLQNPAQVLPGTWNAIYVDRDGTRERPPYTGPRTFSLRIWKSPNGFSGTMIFPAQDAYVPVTLPTTSIYIVGQHVTATAPANGRTITVQGALQCPGPVFNANMTVSSDPDVMPLRFEKQPGS